MKLYFPLFFHTELKPATAMFRNVLRRIAASRVFQGPAFERYPDAFGKTATAVVAAMIRFASERVAAGERVILATWFTDEFRQIENQLNDAGLAFGIGPPSVGIHDLANNDILLCVAESLRDPDEARPEANWQQVSTLAGRLNVMIMQRHPMLGYDEKIAAALRKMPVRVRLGHLLSLDNPLLDIGVPPMMVQVLEQMGINRYNLISSQMLSRRVEATRKRVSRIVKNPQPADSIEEWLALNLPLPDQE